MNYNYNPQLSAQPFRTGELSLSHGRVKTPCFMPVGTLASVKALSPQDIAETGTDIILANAYHLYLRPGHELIRRLGGLHNFMKWNKPILTDSGGFQVYSLSKLRQITEDGVRFQSHIDGSCHNFTPEKVIEIQEALGSDIMMCLDWCAGYPADKKEIELSVKITAQWAKRSIEAKKRGDLRLFGIIQGGMFKELREQSAYELLDLPFDGYAIGGLSVGEPQELMLKVLEEVIPLIPERYPRYLMGVGRPEDIVEAVSMGIDMFDCVIPTRNARNGMAFTRYGHINVKKSSYKYTEEPIDDKCSCYTCRHFSLSYIRHLYRSRELLSYRLLTIHNIHYYQELMANMRMAIASGTFWDFKRNFYKLYSYK